MTEAAIARLVQGLGLPQAEAEEFHWLALHDQAVVVFEGLLGPRAAALASIAAQADRLLSDEEMRGLQALIERYVRAKRDVVALQKGPPMGP